MIYNNSNNNDNNNNFVTYQRQSPMPYSSCVCVRITPSTPANRTCDWMNPDTLSLISAGMTEIEYQQIRRLFLRFVRFKRWAVFFLFLFLLLLLLVVDSSGLRYSAVFVWVLPWRRWRSVSACWVFCGITVCPNGKHCVSVAKKKTVRKHVTAEQREGGRERRVTKRSDTVGTWRSGTLGYERSRQHIHKGWF